MNVPGGVAWCDRLPRRFEHNDASGARVQLRLSMGGESIGGVCGAPPLPPASAASPLCQHPRHQQHVVFLRHGERMDDADRSWSSPRPWDPPLTAHGRDQAGEAGRRLRDLGLNITRVYCSPFLRCIETATQACLALGIPEVHICWDLSEALFRIRAAPEGPLCHWLGLGQGLPPAAASLCAVGPVEEGTPKAASLCVEDTCCRGGGGVSPAAAAGDGATPANTCGTERLLAEAMSAEHPQYSRDSELARRAGAAEAPPLCRCLSCPATITAPALTRDATYTYTLQQQQGDAIGGLLLPPAAHQGPLILAHCCPCSPETAEQAYERYGHALDRLADATPADETVLFVTHGDAVGHAVSLGQPGALAYEVCYAAFAVLVRSQVDDNTVVVGHPSSTGVERGAAAELKTAPTTGSGSVVSGSSSSQVASVCGEQGDIWQQMAAAAKTAVSAATTRAASGGGGFSEDHAQDATWSASPPVATSEKAVAAAMGAATRDSDPALDPQGGIAGIRRAPGQVLTTPTLGYSSSPLERGEQGATIRIEAGTPCLPGAGPEESAAVVARDTRVEGAVYLPALQGHSGGSAGEEEAVSAGSAEPSMSSDDSIGDKLPSAAPGLTASGALPQDAAPGQTASGALSQDAAPLPPPRRWSGWSLLHSQEECAEHGVAWMIMED